MQKQIEEFYQYLVEKKCKEISVYDLTENGEEQYLVIVNQTNQQANKKFACAIMQDFGLDTNPEGFNKGEWIVFDFNNLVLHSFIPQFREKYNLDKLWKAKKIDITKK